MPRYHHFELCGTKSPPNEEQEDLVSEPRSEEDSDDDLGDFREGDIHVHSYKGHAISEFYNNLKNVKDTLLGFAVRANSLGLTLDEYQDQITKEHQIQMANWTMYHQIDTPVPPPWWTTVCTDDHCPFMVQLSEWFLMNISKCEKRTRYKFRDYYQISIDTRTKQDKFLVSEKHFELHPEVDIGGKSGNKKVIRVYVSPAYDANCDCALDDIAKTYFLEEDLCEPMFATYGRYRDELPAARVNHLLQQHPIQIRNFGVGRREYLVLWSLRGVNEATFFRDKHHSVKVIKERRGRPKNQFS
jgi:hypothetical protein